MYKLYSYFRSSAAYRVRIALNLKNIPYDIVGVHLLNDGGQHRLPDYLAKNPQGLIPSLEDSEGHVYRQSLNIIDYLDQQHPKPLMVPVETKQRSYVLEISLMVASDIHPLNNLRVLNYLTNDMHLCEEDKKTWYQHWVHVGLEAIETWLRQHNLAKNCCLGNTPTLADACLIPQVYNALRFQCDIEPYPTVRRIYEHCSSLSPFIQASPENQPDAPE